MALVPLQPYAHIPVQVGNGTIITCTGDSQTGNAPAQRSMRKAIVLSIARWMSGEIQSFFFFASLSM